MPIQSLAPSVGRLPQPAINAQQLSGQKLQAAGAKQDTAKQGELREAFDSFVGETFYGQMLKEMRKTVGKGAYFNGGQAEEMFRGQLDQMLAKQMAKSNGHTLTGPMFELFSLNRK